MRDKELEAVVSEMKSALDIYEAHVDELILKGSAIHERALYEAQAEACRSFYFEDKPNCVLCKNRAPQSTPQVLIP